MTINTLPNASLIKRLAAMVYDSLLIMAVAMAYGAAFLAIKYSIFQVELSPNERAEMGTAGFIGLILVLEMFFWFFWCRGGQTLGMRAWRLVLVQDNGHTPSLLQAMVRSLIAPLSLGLLGLGYWWALWDRQGRSWHDIASHTHVVVLPKKG
ncbi:RDD family protein [Aestuariicella hydrocarbonica]|uniref:RDD family protein n=1 Tax=Pseudomaricurvus hydrocarbonicus TaxID=1470433 RepID=A0A9E5JZ84_9GAMM|nr:RDD family protein [Aestuariicella hydrocarbonica]NHO65207.1 RDD family protein [Aestuariicella hydrocarbonica]